MTPKDRDDSFIIHEGCTEPSIDPNTKVMVYYRNGASSIAEIKAFHWINNGGLADIVKYKVVEPDDMPIKPDTSPIPPVIPNKPNVRDFNVGNSDYASHKIQPWDIWFDWDLNPWDADIIKRTLRSKKGDSRKLDYQKIIHVCQERIRQIDEEVKQKD